MRKVILTGELADKFQPSFELDVQSAAEAVHALTIVLDGFKNHLIETQEDFYALTVGNEEIDENNFGLYYQGDIIISPVVSGAGKGFGKVLLGAALIGASIWLSGPTFAGSKVLALASKGLGNLGFSLALGGVSQMLFGSQKSPDTGSGKPSFAFSGPQNVSDQGGVVPVVYGRVITGSVVASVGLSSQDI